MLFLHKCLKNAREFKNSISPDQSSWDLHQSWIQRRSQLGHHRGPEGTPASFVNNQRLRAAEGKFSDGEWSLGTSYFAQKNWALGLVGWFFWSQVGFTEALSKSQRLGELCRKKFSLYSWVCLFCRSRLLAKTARLWWKSWNLLGRRRSFRKSAVGKN